MDAGIDKPEVVMESYVIDYTSPTFNPLTMDEDGGFSYRYVYGLNTLSVKITSEGTNWWGQHVTTDILKDYYHQDRLGSTTNLTDKFGRVVGRADYNEWGEITYRESLSITSSYRRIYPQSSYTGHDWDDVLGRYYTKASFYSADDEQFATTDPVQRHHHILYKKRKKALNMSLPIDGWKNKGGTSGRTCSCGSWKQHWINFSQGKKWPATCCVTGCTRPAEVGAHVYNTSSTVHGEYIVPACKGCNARTDEFSLKVSTKFVSANKQETCEQ